MVDHSHEVEDRSQEEEVHIHPGDGAEEEVLRDEVVVDGTDNEDPLEEEEENNANDDDGVEEDNTETTRFSQEVREDEVVEDR